MKLFILNENIKENNCIHLMFIILAPIADAFS